MKNFGFVAVALAAVLAGCDDGTGGTAGDTACDPLTDTACDTGGTDPLLIDNYTYVCTPDSADVFGSNWQYTINVSGANSGGLVIVDQDTTPAYHEDHDLTGASTTLGVTLVGAHANPPDQAANVSSIFQCGMDTLMVWRYEVYAPDWVAGDPAADCVVASGSATGPDSVWGSDFGGCANGNSWP